MEIVSKLQLIKKDIRKQAKPERAKASLWFFKTGKGQYGEGDKFLGLTVPEMRKVAYRFLDLSFAEIATLLESPYHEDRFVALEILVARFEKAEGENRKRIVEFYLKNFKGVNNWDLVDTSAPYILGHYLLQNKEKRKILDKLSKSKNLWERRAAIVSTMFFIQQGRFIETLRLARAFLLEEEDLMQKPTGWMLREVGKKDRDELEKFLNSKMRGKPFYLLMGRTMLRYSIEKFPQELRAKYMKRQ